MFFNWNVFAHMAVFNFYEYHYSCFTSFVNYTLQYVETDKLSDDAKAVNFCLSVGLILTLIISSKYSIIRFFIYTIVKAKACYTLIIGCITYSCILLDMYYINLE